MNKREFRDEKKRRKSRENLVGKKKKGEREKINETKCREN